MTKPKDDDPVATYYWNLAITEVEDGIRLQAKRSRRETAAMKGKKAPKSSWAKQHQKDKK